MSTVVAETARLILRPFQPADREAYLAIVGHPAMGRFDEEFPRPPEVAKADFRHALELAPFTRDEWNELAIALRPAGPVAGLISYRPHRAASGELAVTLGFHVHPDHQGQGLASEAMLGFKEALRARGVRRLCAVVDRANVPSIRILTRLGLACAGPSDTGVSDELAYECLLGPPGHP